MKRSIVLLRTSCFAASLLLVAPQRLGAQAAATPSTTAAKSTDEEVLELSPFLVTGEQDQGYIATTTLAGTRIRTELKDVGAAISVVTEAFLKDTGVRNSQDLLVYTANTEVGGIGGNFTANGVGTNFINTDQARLAPQGNTRVRGLTSADNTRDLFLTNIPWDSYNVGRVDMQRGPNSILFGLGSPAGIVNSNLNTALYKNAGSVEFRFGSYGSQRVSLDVNHVVLKDELALRLDAVRDRTYYQQDPAFNNDKRIFGALRYDPRFLNRGVNRTSLKVNYEHGDINANRPRITPPVDAITPWFTALNKQTYDARTIGLQPTPAQAAADRTFGAANTSLSTGAANPNYQPWMDGAMARIYDGAVVAFNDPKSSTQSSYITGERGPKPPGGFPWYVIRGIQPYNVYATKANLPGQRFGIYNPKTLQDASIFDYNNKLIDGPSKSEWQGFEAFNVALSQTFLNNRAGIELAVDRQKYREGQTNLLSPNNGQILTVDVMRVLPDGTTNPNVGRPLVASDSSQNNARYSTRNSLRATAFAEVRFDDFMDRNSLATRILGRHTFTGLFSQDSNQQQYLTWMRYVQDNTGPANTVAINQATRAVVAVSYLGPTLAGSSAAGANISNIQALQQPQNGPIKLFNYTAKPGVTNPNPNNDADWVGWYTTNLGIWSADAGALNQLYTNSATMQRDEVGSQALVWQGHLWDNVVVPTVGWRHDKAKNFNAGSPPVNAISQAQVFDPNWRLPNGPGDLGGSRTYNEVTGNSTSWSVVVHTPRAWREKLPWGGDVSLFYNEGKNFRPDASRRDLFGSPVAAATGKTKDYGVVLSALDDRLVLKVNWYETSVKNVTLDDNLIPNFYLIGAGEAWGYGFATWAKKGPTANAYGTPGASAFGQNYNLDGNGNLIDPSINPAQGGWLAYQPAPGQTVAQAYKDQTDAINALLGSPPPAAFLKNWGITLDPATADWGNMTPWSQPGGVVVTGDTLSKGVEFELTAQPTKHWSVTFNASKTSATRSNLAKAYSDWIEGRYALYQGPAGNVRFWGGAYGGETVRSKFEAETYGPYALFTKLAQGSQAPEIRPWRFNLVTNYSFAQGKLAGFNVGGGYRWQDKVIVGYPYVNNTWDIGHPYKGPALTNIDLWVGYQRRIREKYTWRIQLNVKNAFADKDLIPVTVEPDGSMATGRIPEDTIWTLTNTFSF
jgi:outer membrane receptor for ferric coprogen and ferric-rhodotorulic acid